MENTNERLKKAGVEEPIEPELPICDPHHHLWDRPGSRYLLEELMEDIGGGHNVVQTVFLECMSMYRDYGPEPMRPLGETEFVEGIAEQSEHAPYGTTRVAAGIISFADLTLGDAVAPVLEAHMETSRDRFRGIRHASPWDASPDIGGYRNPPKGWLLDPTFQEGFACLGKYDLSFDAWLYHPQIVNLKELARTFPEIPIILDHVGGPIGIGPYAEKRDEVFEDWKRQIAEIAECPNVVVKLGGLGMPLCGFDWSERDEKPGSVELSEAMAPYYIWCIEQFGVDRCMFESNFPVDKVSYSYTVMWNAFKRMTKDFSADERNALFHDTATRVYRLA